MRQRILFVIVGTVGGMIILMDFYQQSNIIKRAMDQSGVCRYCGKAFPGTLVVSRSGNSTHFKPSEILHDPSKSSLMSTELLQNEQLRRIQYIREKCANSSLFTNRKYSDQYELRGKSARFYYSPKYNFSYCKVPKIGSTFWTQAFTVMRYGTGIAKKVFDMDPGTVHRMFTKNNSVKFNSKSRRNSRSVLLSRDPYSRLYSAYVDKFFLPSNTSRYVNGQRPRSEIDFERKCGTNLSFQNFLNDILYSVDRGKTLNSHWAPVVSLCHTCNVYPLTLVKQESFAADVEFILKEIGIEPDELKAIRNALHDHRIANTVSGYVHIKLGTEQEYCKTRVAKRLWESFQIQGYIPATIHFPAAVDSSEKVDEDFLKDLVLKTIKETPMTTEESKEQRRRFLVDAYKNIDKKTLHGIQEVYKQDFVLFNYTIEPPL